MPADPVHGGRQRDLHAKTQPSGCGEVKMPYAAKIDILAEFQQQLVGHWRNLDFGKDAKGKPVGGEKNPLSYNIMPLPAETDTDGYILKNFKYYERLRFNDDNAKETLAIAAEAPNRGGLIAQNSRALFYEQQVKFAEGPAVHGVVHVENGAWLSLPRFVQQPGAYPPDIDAEPAIDALGQPADIFIAKQIAVPHGNSILALGSVDTVPDPKGAGTCKGTSVVPGSPIIPDAPFPYPMPAKGVPNTAPSPTIVSNLNAMDRYTVERSNPSDYQNPHPELTQCPNRPLQEAVAIIKPTSHMHWRVTTERTPNGEGYTVDIPFENRVSDVVAYWADYWLMFKGKEKYLAYTQTILMEMTIKGGRYQLPHITCNTVTYG